MIYRTKLTLLLLLVSFAAVAQKAATTAAMPNAYEAVDKIALDIPESQTDNTQQIASYINAHFNTDSDKVRAAYIWVASNISYDIANSGPPAYYGQRDETVATVLRRRKGVCVHYAALFNDICQKCGIRSYIVPGYSWQLGHVDIVPHGWCATQVNGQWFFFDPTWGSGHKTGGRFVRDVNNTYYKIPPQQFIESHMPYDPMWQLLNHPITTTDFAERKIAENSATPLFDYEDTLKAYLQLDTLSQYAAATRRIKANGVNAAVQKDLDLLKLAASVYVNNKQVLNDQGQMPLLETAVADYQAAVDDYNDFVDYRNHHRTLTAPSADMRNLIDSAYTRMASAQTKVSNLKFVEKQAIEKLAKLTASINDVMAQIQVQRDWAMGKGK